MKKIELIRQLANRPIGDLPHNNITALLQALGGQGLKIRHMLPFLGGDETTSRRLVYMLMGHGYELTEGEIMAGSVLGWENVLLAPAVLSTHELSVAGASKYRTVPPMTVLNECVLENAASEGRTFWKLVYCAPIPIRNFTLSDRFFWDLIEKQNLLFSFGFSGQTKTADWFDEIPVPGYYLVDFGFKNNYSYDDEGWQKGEEAFRWSKCRRFGAPYLVQSLINHVLIQGALPVTTEGRPAAWVRNETGSHTFVTTENRFDYETGSVRNMVRLETYEGVGLGTFENRAANHIGHKLC